MDKMLGCLGSAFGEREQKKQEWPIVDCCGMLQHGC